MPKKQKSFVNQKKYNTDFCILIDMSIHSGKKRLFLWDFKTNKIIKSGMCSHGCGNMPWGKDFSKTNPSFSNKDGSHCSALGKYKIGERGVSQWGIKVKYLLHGLEETNNNALVRTIVLHSWNDVTEGEVYPEGTPEGWGCPAISNEVMKDLDSKLSKTSKPVLLWIYK
ncbi:murein L,D-transpeptidase catalytic domain-containing protein [Emticicia aquatilis]|nr:murein L,D-transpeptidase catalytic domain family protein [Emticicia aquatilis]